MHLLFDSCPDMQERSSMSMDAWQQMSLRGSWLHNTCSAVDSSMWHLLEREISMVEACVSSMSSCP